MERSPPSSTLNSKNGRFPKLGIKMPELTPPPSIADSLDDKFLIKLANGSDVVVTAYDLEKINELGRGAYGVVDKMLHKPTGLIFAVKRIHSAINDEAQKRLYIELDACMKSGSFPKMVHFYGAMFREAEIWICMEVMDTSLDKFYRLCVDMKQQIPEFFIANVALSIIEALNYMKENMSLIHRDVKPSNILLNSQGSVVLSDFGISGHLVGSVAKTINAGCKPYMPPERIEAETRDAYGVQADVWSLGISLVEIATGVHPYSKWKTPFEQLRQVVQDPAPTIPKEAGYSELFRSFVAQCLTKDYNERPKYKDLLEHPFLVSAKTYSCDIGKFISSVLRHSKDEHERLLPGLSFEEK